MNQISAKQPRVELQAKLYEELRRQILLRDQWRCQGCGALAHLEVHHIQFRSRGGNDSEDNLITLCATCHERKHR